MLRASVLASLILAASLALAQQSASTSDDKASQGSEMLPDIREDETKLKIQKRDFVIVPIPMSNPTLNTGLVVAAAYFWPQTEQQEAAQPASVTAAAGMYTSNESYAYGIAQSSYWNEDRWRFDGMLGYTDLKLDLPLPGGTSSDPRIAWSIKGTFLQAHLLRQVSGNWYAGLLGRYFNMNQAFRINVASSEFSLGDDIQAAGLGFKLDYDSRDMPTNSYSGRHFELDAMFNVEVLGSDDAYQSYKARYRSYHRLNPSVVLAWELRGCKISDRAPLWDACRIGLRGFPVTEFMGNASASGQAEARWQFHPKWGGVAFAGAGYIRDGFSDFLNNEPVPSYGIGIRYMVLDSKRVNLRVDYARSTDNDAVYLSVAEAF